MLADILHFIQIQVDDTALAFGIGISLTLYGRTTTFAGNDFVFRHDEAKIRWNSNLAGWISKKKEPGSFCMIRALPIGYKNCA